MQHLVELRDVHVARKRFYSDDQLELTRELLKGFPNIGEPRRVPHPEHLGYQAGCMRFGVKVAWEGLAEAKSTWEPVSRVFHDAPAVMHK